MIKRQILKTSIASLVALLLLGLLAILMASGTPSSAAPSVAGPESVAGADSWTWRGPSHDSSNWSAPELKHIVIDPANSSIVYACTNQGVYRSTNGGETWEPRNGGLGGYGDLVVSWLAIDPTNHQKLLIGTWGYGLFQSTDSGANWSRLTDPLAALATRAEPTTGPEPPPVRAGGPSDVQEREILPADPNKLRPETVSSLAPRLAGEEGPASAEGLPNALPWTPVRQVAIDPSNTNHLYACIEKGSEGGLFESWNGGGSWSPVAVGTGNCRTITIAPSNTLIRYASFGTWSTNEGLYRSTNGGSSWSPVGGGTINGTVVALAIHPSNPNTVLAATSGDGIYRTLNGGSIWTNVSTELGETTFYSIAFAPNNPTVAYAGGYSWVYRSGDTGDNWTNADASFPTWYVQAVAISPYSSSTLLVGANVFPFGGVYKRTNDGNPFAFKPTGMTDTFVLDLEQDPNDPDVLYAATWGGGVFRSDNGGVTWNSRYGVPYVYSLEATQGPTGTILYGTTFYSDYGILKSYDRGDTWREVSWGWWSDISFDIESLDGGPQTLVVATHHGVERSDDWGQTWALASGLNDGVVLSVARSPANPNRWLAATWGGGIWASSNGAFNWTESSTGLASTYVYDVAYSPSYPDTVYAASLGVHRSSNGGLTWSVSGIGGAYIRALDTLGEPYNDVFAGTHDRGVFMAPQRIDWWFPINSGLTERRIRSVDAVTADKLFAGTNGRGAWEYTLVNRPEPKIRLPAVMRSYSTGGGGFDSQFNGSATGWVTHSGAWYVDDNYLYTGGIAGTSSSASYTEDFSNFTYETRLIRGGCDSCANRLYVRGTPNPLISGNHWYHEYMFQYSRDGGFSIFKIVAGNPTALQNWAFTSAIHQGDAWNTLKVTANGTSLYFYINGTLVWSGSDSSLSSGRVGLGMYRDATSTGDVFAADWARLTTLGSLAQIDDVVSAEQQALNEAANLRGGGSVDMAPSEE